jgi:hypothetical protein
MFTNHPVYGRIAWVSLSEEQSIDDMTPLNFATSADAVLPFLDSAGWAEVNHWVARFGLPAPTKKWRVRVLFRNSFIEGEAPTFARAACIAVIKAKRAEKEAS